MSNLYSESGAKTRSDLPLRGKAVAVLIFVLMLSGLPGRAAQSDWEPLRTGVFARLNTIFFSDDLHGWAGGSNGTLIATSDGGESWKRIPLPQQQQRETIRDSWIFSGGRSLALGEYGAFSRKSSLGYVERVFVLETDDHGASWEEMKTESQPVREAPARIISSKDKEPVLEPSRLTRAPDPVLVRIEFADDRNGWACGESGTIQATSDGGRTWTLQQSPVRKLLYDISVVDAMTVFVAGAGGTLLQTEDGGRTWVERGTGIGSVIRAIHFTDRRNGLLVTAGGEIHLTDNAGVSWRRCNVPTSRPLNDIILVGGEGWAVGDNGTVLQSRDGGRTWVDESFDTHAALLRIHFVSARRGWIAGANGAIYRLTRQ